MVWILEDPVSMVENLLTAASTDPISALLVALGGLFVVAASGALGVLAVGAFFEAIVPDTATQRQRRQRT
ncbi:MAG: hypothetical protein ABEH83_01080 [Halobacterium sp.]